MVVTLFTNVTNPSYIYETIREICKFCEQCYYHFIGWRNDQNKVIDLDKFYNFYIHELFCWNNLLFQNKVWSCYFLKFKIQIDKTQLHENMDKIIAVRTH